VAWRHQVVPLRWVPVGLIVQVISAAAAGLLSAGPAKAKDAIVPARDVLKVAPFDRIIQRHTRHISHTDH
jgi:hypothetical protein